MTNSVIAKIFKLYGLAPLEIAPRQTGYRNHSYHATLTDGREVNLILYKRDPDILARIRRAHVVSHYAAAQGFPTRQLIGPGIVRLQTPAAVGYAALYNYLSGDTIPWEAYTHRHLKLLGATLSNLHAALATMPNSQLIQAHEAMAEYGEILDRMERYFADPGVTTAMARELDLKLPSVTLRRARATLTATSRLPHQQPLHLDFVRGNLLFAGTSDSLTVSGILDFEKTAWGHPLIDIARTLAFLLVDCKYKTPDQIRHSFLDSGYARHGAAAFRRVTVTAGRHRLDLLEELTNLFLLHDFYKFLRHNPYHSLLLNEHFVRTRDLLKKRRLIKPIAPSAAKPVS